VKSVHYVQDSLLPQSKSLQAPKKHEKLGPKKMITKFLKTFKKYKNIIDK